MTIHYCYITVLPQYDTVYCGDGKRRDKCIYLQHFQKKFHQFVNIIL